MGSGACLCKRKRSKIRSSSVHWFGTRREIGWMVQHPFDTQGSKRLRANLLIHKLPAAFVD
jgi:hypothetical protein